MGVSEDIIVWPSIASDLCDAAEMSCHCRDTSLHIISFSQFNVLLSPAKQTPSAAFPSPSGGAPPSGRIQAGIWETAAFGGKKKKLGHLRRPKCSYNFRRAMRIPNMCSVLKLDNRKVVSIMDEPTESWTPSTIF